MRRGAASARPDYRTSVGWPGATGGAVINPDRPFIPDLDDLPMPLHELLPRDRQRMPMIEGPFTFIVTSRGCPAGCKFCIKHVSYQTGVRLRSPRLIFGELQRLAELGIHHVHMYAYLLTVNRAQEEVDMAESTVRDYPGLPVKRLEYWQRRATREWSLRLRPLLTFLKGLNSWEGFKGAVGVGVQTLKFVRS